MKPAVLSRVVSVGLTKVISDPRSEGSKGVRESCRVKTVSGRGNSRVPEVETCLVCMRDRQGDLKGDRGDERLGTHPVGFCRPLGAFWFYSKLKEKHFKQFKQKSDLIKRAILNVVLRMDQWDRSGHRETT